MSDTTSSKTPGETELGTLIAEYQREKGAMADQRKEIALLIKQAVAEIDRLSQRNRDLSSQMRQIQTNIEAFSRTEIQQRYAAFQEAQMRLFMMQSQLEQLRSRQANLEKMEELVAGFLQAASMWRPDGHGAGTPGDGSSSRPPEATTVADAAAGPIPSIELVYRRVSRELQDGPEQVFSDLILRAEVCERLVRVDAAKAREELIGLKQAAAAALKSTRQLVHELQPPALEELGLVAALRRYVEVARSVGKLRVELQVTGSERRLSREVELAVFRIVQEGLQNAALHSGADSAEVKLRFDPEQLIVTVADEGRGFDVASIQTEPTPASSSGLADMQLRARLIGATLEISSRAGAGCMISLAVPA
jgi:two-component system sensor histidine kinase DegS